jgi:hypothetical protein
LFEQAFISLDGGDRKKLQKLAVKLPEPEEAART